jgi:hypothetical protein
MYISKTASIASFISFTSAITGERALYLYRSRVANLSPTKSHTVDSMMTILPPSLSSRARKVAE